MNLGSGPLEGDAFGQAFLALQEDRASAIVIERDDGLVELDPSDYFSPPHGPLWDWIVTKVGRRILDIGAGAGRAALALQAMGNEVLALDVSPGAVEVCRRRGVISTFEGTVHDLAATRPAPFDSFISMGNNLGFLASPAEAVGFLDALRTMAHPDSALAGTMLDPYVTDEPVHLAYHEANRAAGRMSGEVRFRVRFERLATPWFSRLWACREELAQVAGMAGWRLVETTPTAGATYGALLRCEPR
jgi:SAM-dependent methyltransferase